MVPGKAAAALDVSAKLNDTPVTILPGGSREKPVGGPSKGFR